MHTHFLASLPYLAVCPLKGLDCLLVTVSALKVLHKS